MQLIIHRGTHNIGGTCVEIATAQSRIIIDLGMPLEENGERFDIRKYKHLSEPDLVKEGKLPDVKGLYKWDTESKRIDAILISHSHQDHYGYLSYVNPAIPIYASEGCKELMAVAYYFGQSRFDPANVIVKKPWDTFKDIAGMEVTPYLVDHSAADAFAYLIEADKKRIFYAGDFRGHGKKKILFENMLKHPPKNIDLLMLEGTTIEAARVEEQASEQDVEEKLVSLFGENNKLVIFACSHQNIDRLTVLYNACLRTDKTLAMIPYTAYILHKLKILSDKIPQHSMKNIRVFFEGTPNTKRVLADEELCEKLRRVYIGYDEIVAHKERMVVLDSTFVRKQFGRRGYLKDAMLIYSLWDGYLEDVKPFWDDHGVHIKKLHSSGHASVDELKQFVSALKPARIIPIHTKHPEKFHEHFGDIVMKVSDGERVNL